MIEWKYLENDSFKSRYAIAAYYLRECDWVMELGGYKTPFTNFKYPHQRTIVFDQRLEQTEIVKHDHFHIQQMFPPMTWSTFSKVLFHKKFGVCILGMELFMSEEGWQKLFEAINFSSKLIVEFPPKHEPSRVQLGLILERTNKEISLSIKLDLSQNKFEDLSGSAPLMAERNIYVLETKGGQNAKTS